MRGVAAQCGAAVHVSLRCGKGCFSLLCELCCGNVRGSRLVSGWEGGRGGEGQPERGQQTHVEASLCTNEARCWRRV